jgi:hypothetical protein
MTADGAHGFPTRMLFMLAWTHVLWINTILITIDVVQKHPAATATLRALTCVLSIIMLVVYDEVSTLRLNVLSGLALAASLASMLPH